VSVRFNKGRLELERFVRIEDRGLVRHRGRYWAIGENDRLASYAAQTQISSDSTTDDYYGEEWPVSCECGAVVEGTDPSRKLPSRNHAQGDMSRDELRKVLYLLSVLCASATVGHTPWVWKRTTGEDWRRQ
jgi:hypothetical protein